MGPLDVVLLGGAVTLMAGALGGISDGLHLLQVPFLDLPHSFIHSAILLLDKGIELDLLPVAGDH